MSTIQIFCGAGCGASDRVPAETDIRSKEVRPARAYKWICWICWLDGWRNDGQRVFNLDPAKLPAGGPGT